MGCKQTVDTQPNRGQLLWLVGCHLFNRSLVVWPQKKKGVCELTFLLLTAIKPPATAVVVCGAGMNMSTRRTVTMHDTVTLATMYCNA